MTDRTPHPGVLHGGASQVGGAQEVEEVVGLIAGTS